jgi:hypothetical protein
MRAAARTCPGALASLSLLLWTPAAAAAEGAAPVPRIEVAYPEAAAAGPLDGRLILILTHTDTPEPRFQTRADFRAPQVFGLDVEGWAPGSSRLLGADAYGFPIANLADLPPGEYFAQAVFHRYQRVTPRHGKTILVPWDRGEGQQWSRAPGNLYSTPRRVRLDARLRNVVRLALDEVIPPIAPLADTEWVKHVKVRSKLLSEFWGRPIDLGAHVLLPWGFADHPEARYPLMIFHGHFPGDLTGFRTEPPDPELPCEPSERFGLDCYNRIVEEEAHEFYQRWISPGFPRFLAVEIQHPTPFYDDSYAVNSDNNGPYGDAITHELVPEIERRFRALGAGWARFLYGGSTGGWEALAAQIFYPDEYNGAFGACPDPVDFRAFELIDLYEQQNAYHRRGPFTRVPIPAHRDYLGRVSHTTEMENHFELALGSRGRSGGQFDGWQAVYSPLGEDGYPRPIFDKLTGEIDPEVAAHWRERYDLRHVLQRDWTRLAPKLQGKLNVYVGDMDNYYLNDAVYLLEAFLAKADPPYGGEIRYGDRFEHCWNGDPENPNHLTRLRYHTMYLDKILRRIEATAPPGSDLKSWRY